MFCLNIIYTEQKEEGHIKFSLQLRIFHLNFVKECIVIYNNKCFMVDMRCSVAWYHISLSRSLVNLSAQGSEQKVTRNGA